MAPPSSEWFRRPVPRLFIAWWATWWVGNASGYFALRLSPGAGDLAVEPPVTNTLYLLSDVLAVVAGVLATQVVGRVTARQEERARLLETSAVAAADSDR